MNEKIFEVIEHNNWGVEVVTEDENNIQLELERYSSTGHDFVIDIEVEKSNDIIKEKNNIITELQKYYDSYDVSYETYLYLDNTGHGKDGAPYDMKDVYEDLESCKEMLQELINELKEID